MRISVWSSDVCSSDLKRVRFVGLNAYEAEGGVVLRDLFSQNDEGWLQDVALLERLVAAKLTSEAETIQAEGWRWIQIAQEFPYGHTGGLRRPIDRKSVVSGRSVSVRGDLGGRRVLK